MKSNRDTHTMHKALNKSEVMRVANLLLSNLIAQDMSHALRIANGKETVPHTERGLIEEIIEENSRFVWLLISSNYYEGESTTIKLYK